MCVRMGEGSARRRWHLKLFGCLERRASCRYGYAGGPRIRHAEGEAGVGEGGGSSSRWSNVE